MTQAQIEYTVRWNNESYQSGESDWKEKSFLNFDEAKTFAAQVGHEDWIKTIKVTCNQSPVLVLQHQSGQ